MTRFFLASVLLVAAPIAYADPAAPSDVLSNDRARIDQAYVTVDMQAKLVDLQTERVDDLKVAWDRAVREGHPDEAGRLAQEHFDALVARRKAQDALRDARKSLEAARERERADRFQQQNG